MNRDAVKCVCVYRNRLAVPVFVLLVFFVTDKHGNKRIFGKLINFNFLLNKNLKSILGNCQCLKGTSKQCRMSYLIVYGLWWEVQGYNLQWSYIMYIVAVNTHLYQKRSTFIFLNFI